MNEAIHVLRATLFEQVWTTPMMKLAAEYRITGTGLAKVCRKANIPVPPRGYWNKLQHGKPVMKRPPLPNGNLEKTITIQPSEPASGSDPAFEAIVTAERGPEKRIKVSETLDKPHPLVRDTQAVLIKAPKIARGVKLEAGPNTGDDAFDVRVSLPAQGRALRLLDALLKALAARGYALSPRGVTIEGQFIPIGIIEKEDKKARILTESEKKRRYPYGSEYFPNWDYFPNGKLSIFATAYVWWRPDLRKRWSDDRSSLDDKLNEVAIGLIALAIAMRDREDEQRREREEKEELERQRVERLRQANMEKARRDNLVSSTKSWSRAERIRALVAAVEERIASESAPNIEAAKAWIAWATQVAADLDPLTEGLDKVFAEHKRVAEEAAKVEIRRASYF